jgi:hypothetical protein
MRTPNILINIALEDKDAYCVSPETVQEAINRGISQDDINRALVEIQAGNCYCYSDLYLEDANCCAFVASTYEKE